MQEPHIEGVANHDDPESCAAGREARREALTGAVMGWVLSCEIKQFRMPTQLANAEGNTTRGDNASHGTVRRSRRPHARDEASCARTGRSGNRPPWMARRAAMGRPEAESQR